MVHKRSVVLHSASCSSVEKSVSANFGAVYSDNGNLGKLGRNFLCPQKGGGKRMPIVAASYGSGNENRALSAGLKLLGGVCMQFETAINGRSLLPSPHASKIRGSGTHCS
jgi:hypothetical protein